MILVLKAVSNAVSTHAFQMLWHTWLLPDVSFILGCEWTVFVVRVTCYTGE